MALTEVAFDTDQLNKMGCEYLLSALPIESPYMEEGIQSIIDTDYERWVLTIRARFQRAKVSASLKVNNELLRFYLSVGKDIYNNQYENRYGSQFYKRLSIDLQREIPNSKGFSPTNLKYMRYFYELFKDEIQNRPQACGRFGLPAMGAYSLHH